MRKLLTAGVILGVTAMQLASCIAVTPSMTPAVKSLRMVVFSVFILWFL